MANEVLQKSGQQIVWADHAGDFNPTYDMRDGSGNYTNVETDLTGVADGAAWEATYADFGTTRAAQYHLVSVLEWDVAPTAGDVVEFYMAWSHNTSKFPAEVAGDNTAYTGTTADTLANSVKQLDYIGSHVCTVDDDLDSVQCADVGVFTPKARYGALVIKNESAQSFFTDDVEIHIVATPIIDEVQ